MFGRILDRILRRDVERALMQSTQTIEALKAALGEQPATAEEAAAQVAKLFGRRRDDVRTI